MFRPLRSVVLCILVSAVAATSAEAQLFVQIDTLDTGKFPLVRAKVKARQSGSSIRGLTLQNFTVFEDGIIQAPISGGCEDTLSSGPVSVLLVIDKSNSMGPWPFGSNAIVDARRAASTFVDRLSASDEAALLSFNDQPSFDQTWTTDKDLLKTKISNIRTSGGTALWDAIITGVTLIRSRTNKRVMIILSDGRDTQSRQSFTAALQNIQSIGLVAYTIGLGSDIDEQELRQLATVTGGKYFRAPQASDLDQIYLEISREITTTGVCELSYISALDCLDGSQHTVRVMLRYQNDDESDEATFTLPLDSSTFSFITTEVGDDFTVNAGDTIVVPIDITRLTASRPPTGIRFDLGYDRQLLRLDTVRTTALTAGYTIATVGTSTGASLALQGTQPLSGTGPIALAQFTAASIEKSAKSRISVTSLAVDRLCTVAQSIHGLMTISGTCDRAVMRSAPVQTSPRIVSAHPNPFNPLTVVTVRMPVAAHAELILHDALGRAIRTLISAEFKEGDHRIPVDAEGLTAGVYHLRLSAAGTTDLLKIILAK